MNLNKLRWLLQDLIYPGAEPFSEQQILKYLSRRGTEADELLQIDSSAESVEECRKLLEAEDARRQGVEGRLTSIVGLASIGGTVLFGGIWAAATGALSFPNRVLTWTIAIGGFYLALQISRAVFASVEGLSRRNYDALEPSDVLHRPDEDGASYHRRKASKYLELLADHQLRNNDKITKMAVAHRALKNFMVMLIVLAFLGAGSVLTEKREDRLIENLRRDQRVIELLRGPQGPPGPKGDPGASVPRTHKHRQNAPTKSAR